jgi:hypothetical protein
VQEWLKTRMKLFYFVGSKRLVDSWNRLNENRSDCLAEEAMSSCCADVLSTFIKNVSFCILILVILVSIHIVSNYFF